MESTTAEPVLLANRELVTKIVQELTAAIGELKKYDPIATRESYNSDALFGTNPADRVWKMNYYAALGVKARASLSLGTAAGYTDARACADAVIGDGYFAFATTAGTDLGFSVEHLWGLAPADTDFSELSDELFVDRGIVLSGRGGCRFVESERGGRPAVQMAHDGLDDDVAEVRPPRVW